MKHFVISDIHNCYDELMKALAKESFDFHAPDHKIVFLGDAFEKGKKPKETYIFLKEMLERDKLIWVRGNHDIELVNALKNKTLNKTNRSTAIALAQVFNPDITADENDAIVCDTLSDNGFDSFITDNSRDYFELNNYIFVHGFIPLNKRKYDEGWRTYPSEKWSSARKTGAVRVILTEHIIVPEKTVVCGHVGAYIGHVIDNNPGIKPNSPEFKKIVSKITREKPHEYYETYIGKSVIGLDANAYDTGFMNCIVIEE